MLFFLNSDGVLIKTLPSQVNQGSAGANDIYVLAPFSQSLTATIRYERADGLISEDYLMSSLGEFPAQTDDKTLSGWKHTVPSGIATKSGLVSAQVIFRIDGNRLCTSALSFVVAKGVEDILPDEPSAEVYEAILSLLSAIQLRIDSGDLAARGVLEYDNGTTYGISEVVYDGSKVYRSLADNNTSALTDGSKWLLLGDLSNIGSCVTAIANIINGTTIVKKAEQDASGNTITTTYETKTDAQDTKDRVSAIENIINANDNEFVDRVEELLDIFENYPEGVNILDELNKKVDKVEGKGLSENDYTDEDKAIVDGIAYMNLTTDIDYIMGD